ncbi:MAG: response regulator [Aquincola sp.]|nr:response regulator [Aquincola sp.]|tara:strand:+ start:1662 stop:3503 length:1842 start_codon:yes stop_codon:yes gene_type:complete
MPSADVSPPGSTGVHPSQPTPPPPPEVSAQVTTEQLRMLFSHLVPGMLVGTLFAMVLAAYVSSRVDERLVWIWVALKVGIVLPRIAHAQWFKLKGRPGTEAWVRSTVLLLALDGAVWGLGAAYMVRTPYTALVALTSASICSVAAVATFGLQVRLQATMAYVLPMILPTALSLLSRGDQIGWTGGVGLLMLLALLLATARRSELRLAEMFRLRFLNARIAEERALALALAQRESRVKTRFLATMSHELRTPLHGILGLARMLAAEQADPQLRHRLGLIEHSGEHLLQIINDLLDLSRIQAGRVELRPAPFYLLAELEELVDIYVVRCQERGLQFRAQLDVDPEDQVLGDATRLRQVLHNLLGNAVKFTEAGEVVLTARLGTDGLQVSVRDSGPGIAEADLPHVFDAFTQVRRPGTVAGAGVGLGLNIAREITHAMRGQLQCRSQLGVGTVFELSLPLMPLQVAPAHAANDEAPLPAHLPQRVLLAEDNEVNAMLAEAMLRRLRCQVQHVRDGQAAVAAAGPTDERPDLVLMDCQMPLLDGVEATRRIREAERQGGLRRVPVVALTANSAQEDRERCAEAGMDAFLSKPFTEEELRAVMAAVIGGRPSLPGWGG